VFRGCRRCFSGEGRRRLRSGYAAALNPSPLSIRGGGRGSRIIHRDQQAAWETPNGEGRSDPRFYPLRTRDSTTAGATRHATPACIGKRGQGFAHGGSGPTHSLSTKPSGLNPSGFSDRSSGRKMGTRRHIPQHAWPFPGPSSGSSVFLDGRERPGQQLDIFLAAGTGFHSLPSSL
jgi:hypothetical protein